MTDEEKAEEYARKTLSKDCCDLKLEVYKRTINSFLAGLHEGQPKWHDLRKDPNDLPLQGEKVFIADEYSKYYKDREPTTAWREENCWMSMDEWNKRSIDWKVYAWHEIPKIPKEFMKE